MAQPDGVSHSPSVVRAVPANSEPENPTPTSPNISPVTPAHHGFQRVHHWRDPFGWLLPVASAAISFLAAAVLFRSSAVAFALLALIVVHEMGHIVALKLKRIPVSAPIFIPLIGAFVVTGQIKRVRDVAFIALAGPFSGGLGALACLLISQHIGDSACLAPVYSGVRVSNPCFSYLTGPGYSWLKLAYVGFFFNLVNLLPIFPLDGGRVAATISRWLWPLGALLSVAFLYLHPTPLTWGLTIIAIGLTIWAFWERESLAPVPASVRAKIGIAIAYVGLALLLAAGTLLTQDNLQIARLAPFMSQP